MRARWVCSRAENSAIEKRPTTTFRRALTASVDSSAEIKISAPSVVAVWRTASVDSSAEIKSAPSVVAVWRTASVDSSAEIKISAPSVVAVWRTVPESGVRRVDRWMCASTCFGWVENPPVPRPVAVLSLCTKHGSHHHCTPQPVAPVPDCWMLVSDCWMLVMYATETEWVIFVRSILSDGLIGWNCSGDWHPRI